jgi:hypothetical protein
MPIDVISTDASNDAKMRRPEREIQAEFLNMRERAGTRPQRR